MSNTGNTTEVLANLDNFISNMLPEVIENNLTNGCLMIVREAKEKAPVDDGILRASIDSKVQKDGSMYTGTVGTNLEYAPYVHQGTGIHAKNGDGRKTPWYYTDSKGRRWKTVGQKPQPFLLDAASAKLQDVIRLFEGVIN